jgi:hypothetical protein
MLCVERTELENEYAVLQERIKEYRKQFPWPWQRLLARLSIVTPREELSKSERRVLLQRILQLEKQCKAIQRRHREVTILLQEHLGVSTMFFFM